MDHINIFNDIIELVKPYCKNLEGLKSATGKTLFFDDLQINSARLVDIILAIEEKYNISIDDESADNVRSVGDAVELVVAKMA